MKSTKLDDAIAKARADLERAERARTGARIRLATLQALTSEKPARKRTRKAARA